MVSHTYYTNGYTVLSTHLRFLLLLGCIHLLRVKYLDSLSTSKPQNPNLLHTNAIAMRKLLLNAITIQASGMLFPPTSQQNTFRYSSDRIITDRITPTCVRSNTTLWVFVRRLSKRPHKVESPSTRGTMAPQLEMTADAIQLGRWRQVSTQTHGPVVFVDSVASQPIPWYWLLTMRAQRDQKQSLFIYWGSVGTA